MIESRRSTNGDEQDVHSRWRHGRREAYRVLARINRAGHDGELDDIIRRATTYVQETTETTVSEA